MKNLRVFASLADYNTAKGNQTLICPNVSYIQADGSVKFLKSNPPTGVGIKDLDSGAYYSLAEYQALETPPTNAVVYVASESASFIIHPTINTSVKWSNDKSTLVPNCSQTTSSAQAILKFTGEADTNAVIAAVQGGTLADAPLFTWARTTIGNFADGTIPYIPATGELDLIRLNNTEISACRTALNQTQITIQGSNWWSSTQCNASTSWLWFGSYWGNGTRTDTHRAVALGAL